MTALGGPPQPPSERRRCERRTTSTQGVIASAVLAIGFLLGGTWLWIAGAFVVIWILPYAILKILDLRDWLLERLGR